MSPRRVDTTARRAEILDAAVRVFARKGFAASRVEDVAAAAGIAKGSVYLAFDSREDLLRAIFEDFAERTAAGMRRARTAEGPALDRLAELIRSTFVLLTEERETARILFDLWSVGRGGDSAAPLDMARVYGEYRAAVTDLLTAAAAEGDLRPGVGPGHATAVVGVIEGCLLQCLIDPALPVEGLADTIVDLCVHGLRREVPA
ncbi:TetR/AcrR family transcriptional regulator [Nocardia farcinica]|uniref:Fatty acid metabolism regulator protein n=1 Tax=Nocardia farcinica TaxID=37329 RepID=A0A449GFX7_NOCFR|nr:TetR/AcrR family transcriptional regulator [Nocardia farcinica]MBF6229942.1 TetR/AcrR family transcriptional regulator [Nocardia farcinica]VFA91608.1 Fatty acid metabolism regulator protein [Nocardia farcinica]